MVNDSEKLKKIKGLVILWYKVAPALQNKYNGRSMSTYNKKDIDRVNKLKNEINHLAEELMLTNADKFRILMELI